MSDLTFVRVTHGAQLHLSDGSVWRIGRKFVAIPFSWGAGDPVTLGPKSGIGFDQVVTHTTT
ncbi:MAG: hypothetical protein ACYDD1_16245 [Caulobacteraceae bacterium]